MLIIIAVAVTVAVILSVIHRRAANNSDLGWVTERWLTEYRADQSADSK